MLHDGFQQPLAQSAPAMRFQHEHIAKISNGCKVGDNPRKPDLPGYPTSPSFWGNWRFFARIIINPEAQRMLNRSRDEVSANPLRPVAVRKKSVDHFQIKQRLVGADQKIGAPGFHDSVDVDMANRRHPIILTVTGAVSSQHSALSHRIPSARWLDAEC